MARSSSAHCHAGPWTRCRPGCCATSCRASRSAHARRDRVAPDLPTPRAAPIAAGIRGEDMAGPDALTIDNPVLARQAEILARPPTQAWQMANAIRALAIDAVEAAKSGHPGMPM